MKNNLLIVDDDEMIHSLFEKALIENNYEFIHAYNGKDGITLLVEHNPVLILLDILMPESDGVELCQQMRKITNVPIIFVTSKTALFDKITCFGAGGDDFIEKPFSPEEILMRVRSHIRRYRELTGLIETKASHINKNIVLDYPPLKIDIGYHLVSINDIVIPFTAKEFKILEILAKNPNKFFSSDQLLSLVWDDENSVDNNSLISHISKIRKKLSVYPELQNYIMTVRNVGYKFSPDNC